MKCHIQHEPLVLEEFELATWATPPHLRNHFELIQIQSGCGEYEVNSQRLSYQAGSLFLLGPADSYSFVLSQPTRFRVVKFTEDYLTKRMATGIHPAAWQHLRDSLLHPLLGLTGHLQPTTVEQQQLDAMLAILFAETNYHGRLFNDTLAESLVGAVLSFVGRQLAGRPIVARMVPSHTASCVQRLLAYIRRHISEPSRLRVEQLAAEFAYSPSHLSALFKQETGESLRQYILRYRLKLVESRLLLSPLTVSQIADELAFTDVCHLNKLFKKHYHATPSDYRRHLATLAPATV